MSRMLREQHTRVAVLTHRSSPAVGAASGGIALHTMVVDTHTVLEYRKIRQPGYLAGQRKSAQDKLASVDAGLEHLLQQLQRRPVKSVRAKIQKIQELKEWWKMAQHSTDGPAIRGQRLGALDAYAHWKAGKGDEVTLTWLRYFAAEAFSRFKQLDKNLAYKACYAILAIKSLGLLLYVAEDCMPDPVSHCAVLRV